MARLAKYPSNKKTSNLYEIKTGKEVGRWRWDVRLVKQDGSVYRKAGTKGTESEARKARDAAFTDFNVKGGRASAGYTVKEWCELCLETLFTEQKPTTKYAYGHWLKTRVYNRIGAVKLDQLTPENLQMLWTELQSDGEGASVALRTRVALNACLTLAVRNGHIDRHIGRLTTLKKSHAPIADHEGDTPGKRILTTKEQQDLLKQAEGTIMYMPILLGLKFGLRLGECLGLHWKDVDFAKQVIRVRGQVQRIYGKGKEITTLKTENSVRQLPIPASVLDDLKQACERSKATECAIVCPNSIGTLMTPQEAAVKFKRIAKDAKVNREDKKGDATHHDLRATFLSFLANVANDGHGVRPSVLMRLAGHSKIDTTMRFYVRATESDLEEAMAFIQ